MNSVSLLRHWPYLDLQIVQSPCLWLDRVRSTVPHALAAAASGAGGDAQGGTRLEVGGVEEQEARSGERPAAHGARPTGNGRWAPSGGAGRAPARGWDGC